MQAGGQRFESVILHEFLMTRTTFYDMLYRRKKKSESRKYIPRSFLEGRMRCLTKVVKGTWRMPRLSEAMKDVISCEKPR